ncbi:unnamed protein product [Spirodela intermedia]|uniref:Helicase ATP-binding domain-containing protein n=1 Tax=Spirodela intermedia TaxID=51605 RepID=A0A7I8JN78_SPIIN|nr:unnamed protein product [Spirodela intermedia]CAA6671599.1 unnamed protein product [Spirodela intermedia]
MEVAPPPPPPKPRREFPAFPYDPYPIQSDFMVALYGSLDRGGVAMLESPTGTGKTLSIICSALQWIVDRRQRAKVEQKVRATKTTCRHPGSTVMCGEQKRFLLTISVEIDEAEFLVEEYESEEDEMLGTGKFKTKRERGSGWNSSDEEDEASDIIEDDVEVTPKIYFCSRTHSQLSQFVGEFKKTKFASELNAICLGARKNLCINKVINERCLELQTNKKGKNVKESKCKVQSGGGKIHRRKASIGCPMLKKRSLQTKLRNEVLDRDILDIEDLIDLGKKIGTCPYYGARRVVPAADIVILPYQSLLLKSARESLGLNLKNNIVIIDEAHNLADSLTNMYNSRVTVSQLDNVRSYLDIYFERFRACLGAGNRRYIQTIMGLTKAFLGILLRDESDTPSTAENSSESKIAADSSLTINEFLFSLEIDNINLVKLCQYIKESNIIHKVSGYGAKVSSLRRHLQLDEDENNIPEGTIISSFQALSDLLYSLTYSNDDGRMIISRRLHLCPENSGEGCLKFVMLSGDKIFSEITEEAHAVVLAGGTLQPIEETRIRLFPGLPADNMHFFSCNHIVPPESILPVAICRGPSGKTFDFSYSSRSSPDMMEELGRLLCNLAAVVPEGIVMFFSSFDYEGLVYEAWKTSGVLARIQKKKLVFREPRSSGEVELVLKEYREAIAPREEGPSGALLLAVVGGKVSEGINFSDGMGRCVVMVGLPYPNPSDVELMERVKYIDRLGESAAHATTLEGREYYENLCMKAVNQSVGRAIRHIKDYAAILLVDSRYGPKPSHLIFPTGGYGEVHRLLRQFFQFNRQR